ncbi:sensor histidine kinase [Natronocalculus amylovorans]|uniref:histidine kinase n=1 Tax=Natronocalculus amylovorans TaxID=2917812 RepID=A0AAE3KBT6_9EURY|nr:PAS domain-containing sensor histidine kinase [Natronocalculus amylovorans]MCL9817559.1 PAS domain-containing sensor histidine kinase [Natronocalculus amylovorans]
MADYSSKVYEDVFRSIQNPALIIGCNFVIEDANEAAVKFLRYDDLSTLLGTPVTDILFDEEVLEEVASATLNNETWHGETELLAQDGTVIYGVGSAVPITEDNEVICLAGVFTDLTKQRQYTRSLNLLSRVLRHNIRNDINVVQGYVQLLSDRVTTEEEKAQFEMVQGRLDKIVDRAHTARKLEYLLTRDDEVTSAVRIDSFLHDAVTAIQQQYPEATVVGPTTEAPYRATANHAVGDAFEKIIENGIVHNTSKTPVVEVTIEETPAAVVVYISDNGPGISVTDPDELFGRCETSPLNHGDGMSLFFVDALLKTYGGQVWVEGDSDSGTTFGLSFPKPA